MSICLDPCSPQIPQIIAGADAVLDVKLINQQTGDPLDLSAATEIEAILLNADNSFLELKLSLSQIVLISGPGGHFQIIIPAASSALLALSPVPSPSVPASNSDMEIHLTIGGKLTIINLIGVVTIVARRFPAAP